MIGTIRKHSSWLWYIIAALTIISFVWWGASPGTRYGGGAGGGLGTIYGKAVTTDQLYAARNEFLIWYWIRNHEFPTRQNTSEAEIERGSYERLMLEAKARELGIHVTQEAQIAEAQSMLSMMGRDGQPVPPNVFVENVLKPQGLTAGDFQRAIAGTLTINQLVLALGLSGELVPPQEAAQLYDHDHQDFSAQVVFFSATNYASQIAVTPAAVATFYTNHMAEYRLPDRVQLNYVAFVLSNYNAAAEKTLGKTNISAKADAYYAQHGMEAIPGATSPEDAKAKIRDLIVKEESGRMAVEEARNFARTLFAIPEANANTLLSLAKTNGLAAHTTAPFSEVDGPAEFFAPADLVKTAFKLSPDSPFGPKPLASTEAVYVIALAKTLPSEIEPLAEIHSRVTSDFKNYEATLKARAAGTNFVGAVAAQMGAGKSFAQVALADGQAPVALKPFSLSSRSIPETDEHAEAREVIYAAAQTQPGHISSFMPTADGGFVLFVQSVLPIDESLKSVELPKFIEQLRRNRLNEAFNRWLMTEENRELQNTPVPKALEAAQKAAAR